MAFYLKTLTPDTSLPQSGFLFGADSQAAASPSVFSVPTVKDAMNSGVVVLTDAAFISWDVTAAPVARVTLGGNRTLMTPLNIKDGGIYRLYVIQDATGGRTLAYDPTFNWTGGTAPDFSTATAGQIALLTFWSDGVLLYGSVSSAYAGFAPSIVANFASPAWDVTPPSWLDYSGTTGNRMYFDSTGKLTWAPNNLVQQSQALATSPWSNYTEGTGVTPVVTNNAGVAPDNTNTATRVQLDCGAGGTSSDRSLRFQGSITIVTGTSYIISVYVKAYDAGNVGKTIRVGANGLGNLPIVTLTSSWQRVHLLATATGTGGIFNIETRGTFTTQTADVLVWGAQLEAVTYQTTPSTYQPTTSAAYYGPRFDYDPVTLQPKGLLVEGSRANLLQYSDQFDNAYWFAAHSTVTANQTTSPDGTPTADLIADDTTASVTHAVQRSGIIISAAAYTLSVYAKNNTRRYLSLRVNDNNSNSNAASCVFDLQNGSISGAATAYGTFSAVSGAITNVGNNWYRLTLTFTSSVTSISAKYELSDGSARSADGQCFYTGNGSSLYLWGAQLEAGSFATSYIPTTTAQVTRAADVLKASGAAKTILGATTGTAIMQARVPSIASYVNLLGDASRVLLWADASTTLKSSSTTPSPVALSATIGGAGTWTGGAVRAAVSWSAAGRSIVANNGTVASDSNTFGTATDVPIFLVGNGTIECVSFYSTKLPDTVVKSKSTVGAAF